MMKVSKLGSVLVGLGGTLLIAAACGGTSSRNDGPNGPVGGGGGSAEAGGAGEAGGTTDVPIGGSGDAGGGSGAPPVGGAGGAAGTGGSPGEAGNGGGDAGGDGGAGGATTCEYFSKTYEVGETWVGSMELCTCEATGLPTCVDGCDPTEAEIFDIFDQVKACDPDDADSCSVEITYDNLYYPECTWSVTAAGAELAKQLTPKLELLKELDCDADTIAKLPCPATRSTTCLPSGICADFAE